MLSRPDGTICHAPTCLGDVMQIEQMQQANVELRALLNSYLASPVNKELQIPPMHVA